MRLRHSALAAVVLLAPVLLVSISGCSVLAQGTLDGQRAVAADAATKAAIAAAKVAVVSYTIENPGAMPEVAQLEDYGYMPTESVTGLNISGTPDDFCVQATSETTAVFHATLDGSVDEGACP